MNLGYGPKDRSSAAYSKEIS